MQRLQNKIAVITGGTSGIGLATAQRFVAERAFVYIFARHQEELDQTVASLGANSAGVAGDVRKLEDLDRLYARVAADGRKLDILLANVGAVDSVKLADVTIDSFNHNFEVNARGLLFTVQKSLPLMNNGASIILTSTIASLRGFPVRSAYAASKVALRSYARTWTMELKDRSIRVNTITPGPCGTPLIDAQESTPEAAAATRAKHAANIPLGRMARSEEIAGAMFFLASEDNSFVAGSELLVDGGMCSV
ncbi:SDR family NAD(P)-dependent oxidoreductase [Paraburkholderia silvatlantica]|uniref:SDR family NAD(P)-dependent oxidoreductase n=1 Tax=Paraburkholderia silvatlantica TaxID=321895 RepID=UPI00105CF864|nr:SDR family oxidoreductase [Paraburkholderia silvatlantica]TDQ89543.1 NAD(P)-dependent dehydrogenase (short-subunit alcohol dehydrogenase family) [Paraburkholderia silvatlantica]